MKTSSLFVFRTLLLFLACNLCIVNTTYADDTDIFLGRVSEASLNSQPNVLFILDNSGSMTAQVYDERGNPTGKTRIETMKESFSEIMNEIHGVNVGVMRFNGPGASILYPITNADQVITENQVSHLGMRNESDDAIESMTNGSVRLSDDILTIGYNAAYDDLQTKNVKISSALDDLEQKSDGYNNNTTNTTMKFASGLKHALRFPNVAIPQGATIVDARVLFTASASNANNIHLNISAEKVPNAAALTNTRYLINNRLLVATNAKADWEMTAFNEWNRYDTYSTPTLAPVVQEIVNQATWSSGNNLNILFEYFSGSGERNFYTSSSTSSRLPVLEIKYSLNGIGYEGKILGLRFENVDVPANATISSAHIEFTSSMSNPSGAQDLDVEVQIQNSPDAEPFLASANNLSSRPKVPLTKIWKPEAEWTAQEVVTGPDVTDLVQHIVSNQTGWCGNNAMAFFLKPAGASADVARMIYAYESGLNRQAVLKINYDEGRASGCKNGVVEKRVGLLENDAREDASQKVRNSEKYISFSSANKVGLRFSGLPIEKNAVILDAYLEFTAYPFGLPDYCCAETDNQGSIEINFTAHKNQSAPAFPESKSNISARPKTTASKKWNPGDWEQFTNYKTPNLKDIIQELVNQSSWTSGNSISLLASATGSGGRGFFTFDGSTGYAPKLVIKVSEGGLSGSKNTVASYMNGLVQDLDATTWTPIVDSLYEAALYFSGKPVYYGTSRALFPQIEGSVDKRYNRVSVEGSYTGGTHFIPALCPLTDLNSTYCREEKINGSPIYVSPITEACQTNHIVLLTDGEANNNHSRAAIADLTGVSTCGADTRNTGEKCGRTLTKWLANNDVSSHFPNAFHNVKTHTIAFNLSNNNAVDFLQDLATEGQGTFHSANTAGQLVEAFDKIIQQVLSQDATFTSAAGSVNQFNRVEHRSDIYFSVFKPEKQPRWEGNLKRYQLLGTPPVLSDANNQQAMDNSTGFFKDLAKSFWSSGVDGKKVGKGGAADNLPTDVNERNIYTYWESELGPKQLSLAENKVVESNIKISADLLQVDDAAERLKLIQWIRGHDVQDIDIDGDVVEARKQIGDALHSVPTIITYGGTEENPDSAIIFGTNAGFLHSIDSRTGAEIFSFVPESLFPIQKTLFDNMSTLDHPSGFDGSPEVWLHDSNKDGFVNDAADHAYVYMGMRRGGKNYYALDLSKKTNPKILWVIQGGSGNFSKLGQTWSKPVFFKAKINNEVKDLLIFGGGFDPTQENSLVRVDASQGNAIYIVDANTGDLIWSASNTTPPVGLRLNKMNYSIPAEASVLDINGDGLADQFYFGDTGGQIWRFDIHTGKSASSFVSGGVIAELAGSTAQNNRKFFNKIDASLVAHDGKLKLAISVGSGLRYDPLEKQVEDNFFVVFQNNVFQAPEEYSVVLESDLVSRNSSTIDEDIEKGWMLKFDHEGEKVLSDSITLNNSVIFTTYEPNASVSPCSVSAGVARAYVIDIRNANPKFNLDNNNQEDNKQHVILKSPIIPASPRVFFSEDSSPAVLIGPEQPFTDVDFGMLDEWQEVFWQESDE